MRSRIVLMLALMFLIIGCSDEMATADREKAKAEHEAQQQAEQRLMSDMATASAELQKRVSEWLWSDKGLMFVVDDSGGPSFNLHAMPASTPWHVSCNAEEIELTVGSWEASKHRNAKLFTRLLSFARFSEQQCKQLAAVVARKMMSLTAAARSP